MRLGLIGYGAIARALTGLIDPPEAATALVRSALGDAPDWLRAVTDAEALIAARPDLVVEAAGHGALAAYGPAILRAGIPLVAASTGALADDVLLETLREAAAAGGTRLHLPAGAIGGIDILAAVAEAGDLTLRYTGTKPPAAWRGTPAAEMDLAARTTIFEGTAREAARLYPKNANVAATLALAGAGWERTAVMLVSDPEARGNAHAWTADGPLGAIAFESRSLPAPGNAASSMATVHSLHRAIRNLTGTVAL